MKKMLASYFWITVGCVIYAIAFDWLFVPNQIGFGGITGIGQILNYYIPALPIGVVVIVLNIPLFLYSKPPENVIFCALLPRWSFFPNFSHKWSAVPSIPSKTGHL